jgi:hypothetical protein
MRNLDSKIHLPGFDRFKLQFHVFAETFSTASVMCGRRLIGKNSFDVDAALVGCGHVSGLFVRRGWPLALMLSADQVPIESKHSKMR